MIIGNANKFAIESRIKEAYSRISFRALGFFILHVGGRSYGVRSPEATMLACSLDEVKNRLLRRGSHLASHFESGDAEEVLSAVWNAIYSDEGVGGVLNGLSEEQVRDIVYGKHILWAPDGDEAFDDGSFVLHFDVGPEVRLIAFKKIGHGDHVSFEGPVDIVMCSDEFYSILQEWVSAFEDEWKSQDKISDIPECPNS